MAISVIAGPGVEATCEAPSKSFSSTGLWSRAGSAGTSVLFDKPLDVGGIEAKEPPPLDVRQPTLLNQTPDMTHVHTELPADILDGQQW